MCLHKPTTQINGQYCGNVQHPIQNPFAMHDGQNNDRSIL